jgi:hypothetical protein
MPAARIWTNCAEHPTAMEAESRTIHDLHADHMEWWNMLCAWQQELTVYNKRLADVLGSEGPEVHAEVEQFQNRFVREQEVVDELQHLIKTHEDSLAKKVAETPHVATGQPYRDHAPLRERMGTAQKLHAELRTEFMAWLAAVRGGLR